MTYIFPERGKIDKAQFILDRSGLREVSFFTGRGLLKIGGIRYFFLDQKGGSKDFFKLIRGDHLYFLKK